MTAIPLRVGAAYPTAKQRAASVRVQVSRLGMAGHEPTLGATRDGTVFYSAWTSATEIHVMRSPDDGRSWNDVSPQAAGAGTHPVSQDAYLYVDETTDRLFTVDLNYACSILSFSDDYGSNWTTNPIACGQPVNDHQTVFAGRPVSSPTIGYPNVVYYCWSDLASSSCSKSLDGGISFVRAGTPAFAGIDPESGKSCGGLTGHGTVDGDGRVLLPRELCGRPMIAWSTDEGATWQETVVSDLGSPWYSDPSVAVDARGNVYYGWVAKDRHPYIAISRDHAKTWSEPIMVARGRTREANLFTLDAGARGRVGFVFMGTQNKRFPKTWNGYIGRVDGLLTAHPHFATARVNPARDPLKTGPCGPGRCGTEVLDFLDVTVAADGSVWGSFVDACTGECTSSGYDAGNEALAAKLVSP